MSTKYVIYLSSTALPCGCKGTANVIMCTRFDQTVPGQIVESSTSGCSGSCSYNIQYDSEDLPEGVTALATDDIVSVACKGCFTTWVEEQFTPQVVNEVSSLVSWDFKDAATDDTYDAVTFTITNPSAVRSLVGIVGHRIELHLVNNTTFAAGFGAGIYQDGSLLAGTGASLQEEVTSPGGTLVEQFGGSGFAKIELAPGASSTFVLRFTASNFTPVTDTSVAFGQMWFQGALSA